MFKHEYVDEAARRRIRRAAFDKAVESRIKEIEAEKAAEAASLVRRRKERDVYVVIDEARGQPVVAATDLRTANDYRYPRCTIHCIPLYGDK